MPMIGRWAATIRVSTTELAIAAATRNSSGNITASSPNPLTSS
jgi:hypothetical protein